MPLELQANLANWFVSIIKLPASVGKILPVWSSKVTPLVKAKNVNSNQILIEKTIALCDNRAGEN